MKSIFKKITTGFAIFRLVMKDSRTPFLTKILVGVALVYLFLPFDMIPDFITLLGQTDDIVIVLFLILAAFKIIPQSLIEKYRRSISEKKKDIKQ